MTAEAGFYMPVVDSSGRTHRSCDHVACAGWGGSGWCHICDQPWPCRAKTETFR